MSTVKLPDSRSRGGRSDIASFDSVPFDVFDPFQDDPLDRDAGPMFDWIPNDGNPLQMTAVPPKPRRKVHSLRKSYGLGIDARRTAVYRCHNVEDSPMYHFLENRFQVVSNAVLLALANAVVENSPAWSRPRPPTRSEKRVKAGLVLWMIRNSPHVMEYFSSPQGSG
jgi:hypothetical protein